jgi:hypothetical protein
MERQATVLGGDSRRTVVVNLGEAALRMVVGSSAIMATQIEHLRSVDVNVDVRVLPFSAGAYPRRGSFALLDFEHDDDPSVAYVEGPGAARYFDRPAERAEYEHVFEIISKRVRSRSEIRMDEWIKARASADQGSCVEVRPESASSCAIPVRQLPDGSRQVRDTKDQGQGPVLTFTRVEWEAFLDGARNSEFD